MEETINRLIAILNKYSIKELNKIYRDKEVELEIESFTKHPDVRWSENMKKRMIQAAKRKRISKGRCIYIEEQIDELNNYNSNEHIKTAINDVRLWRECVAKIMYLWSSLSPSKNGFYEYNRNEDTINIQR